MRASFSNHTAAAQKGIKRPGLVFGTEEVAQWQATTVVRAWVAVTVTKESFSVFPLTPCSVDGTSYFPKPFQCICSFSSGHSSSHPVMLTGAGLDLSSS